MPANHRLEAHLQIMRNHSAARHACPNIARQTCPASTGSQERALLLRQSCHAMASSAQAEALGAAHMQDGVPSLAHRRQMSDVPFRRGGTATSSPRPAFMRQRSTTLEGLSVASATTGRRKPIEMSSELKAAKLQVPVCCWPAHDANVAWVAPALSLTWTHHGTVGGCRWISSHQEPNAEFMQESSCPVLLRAVVPQALLTLMMQEFAAAHGPSVILLDDCHLFDSTSWHLLAHLAESQVWSLPQHRRPAPRYLMSVPPSCYLMRQLCQCMRPPLMVWPPGWVQVPGLLIVAAMRPNEISPSPGNLDSGRAATVPSFHECASCVTGQPLRREVPAAAQTMRQALHVKATVALEAILRSRGTVQMQLPPLTQQGTSLLISSAFGGADVAPELTHEIHDKTGGLPLYVEQVQSKSACTAKAACAEAPAALQVIPMCLQFATESLVLWYKNCKTSLPAHCIATCKLRNMVAVPAQVVVFLKQQLGAGAFGSSSAAADVGTLLRSPALAYFIRSTVTIHTVLTHRIDHLRPSVQLTLKVASVMGMRVGAGVACRDHLQAPASASLSRMKCKHLHGSYADMPTPCNAAALVSMLVLVHGMVSVDLLIEMYPIHIPRSDLEQDIKELQAAGFLAQADQAGSCVFSQVHASAMPLPAHSVPQQRSADSLRRLTTITKPELICCGVSADQPRIMRALQVLARDVAYELIPTMQRRTMHARLAQVLETQVSGKMARLIPPSMIAYHYAQSCRAGSALDMADLTRILSAIEWWEKAADDAMHAGMDQAQALRFFQKTYFALHETCWSKFELAGKALLHMCMQAEALATGSDEFFRRHYRLLPTAHSSGASFNIIDPVRRARWERCMCTLSLELSNSLDDTRRHALQALHYLSIPLPAEIAALQQRQMRWWHCMCYASPVQDLDASQPSQTSRCLCPVASTMPGEPTMTKEAEGGGRSGFFLNDSVVVSYNISQRALGPPCLAWPAIQLKGIHMQLDRQQSLPACDQKTGQL
ncbi:Adenylate cyclase type 10 [Sticta canariensis]|nr:Adenylate cyclase type 10 [Sticta canariensis]